MRMLRTFVAVASPDAATVAFGPGDELPDWAAEQITNPDAWAEADASESAPEPAKPKVSTRKR